VTRKVISATEKAVVAARSGKPKEKPATGVDDPDAPLPTPEWPEPLAEEAFHGLAGRFVRVVEPASEADLGALLVQFLLGAGNMVGRTAHAVVENDRHYLNEYAVLVGRSAKGRKGTSMGRVKEPLTRADQTWAEERIKSGLSSGEGLIWNVRDPIEKRERVSRKNEPARFENVIEDEGVSDKRLFVVEPEFANILKQTERQGNTLSAILRQGWDGGKLQSLTKNSPARATDAHILDHWPHHQRRIDPVSDRHGIRERVRKSVSVVPGQAVEASAVWRHSRHARPGRHWRRTKTGCDIHPIR
jgi:hypothetical protein